MAQTSYKNKPGDTITGHASGAITGKRFVAISGAPTGGNPTVAQAGAGVLVYGVALEDRAAGEKVALVAGNGVEVWVEAGAAIAAGARVASAADGRAVTVPATQQSAGIAVTAPTAAGQEVLVNLGFVGVG